MAAVNASPPVHLIIRLPYNRSDAPVNDPLPIQWNADKENMLWEVIARSRAADSGGTDWQGLSAHLQVPLPYLLYRAQVRYEEDLRGLQDIKSTLNTSNPLATRSSERQDERSSSAHPVPPSHATNRMVSSIRRRTPIAAHQIGPSNRSLREQESASTLAQSQRRGMASNGFTRTTSASSSESSSDEADKVEEEERRQEEQEAVGRRLKELEKMMSSDMLGFARPPRPTPSTETISRSPLRRSVHPGDSTSGSSPTSPQGSIPSIPSPPPESQSQSSQTTSSSTQAATSPVNPHLFPPPNTRQQHQPRRTAVAVRVRHSRRGSSHGSSASSFSDLSDAASVSASALESALMSNIRGGGSRLSMFARSHFGAGRGGGAGH
ncbi:hypothetical protein K439DRAFT_32576 [Ramaria rubella]|nr:hypothetical protein K439DRAFT_32576 [Ramaria rubella]